MRDDSLFFPLPQGLARIEVYDALLKDDAFSRMEAFSDGFISRHREALSLYRHRWVADPLHQWSRQWEYPFVHAAIAEAATGGERPLKVLDAGSGITFFPYYLALDVANADVTCCDQDPSLARIFERVSRKEQRAVRFVPCDLVETGFEEGAYDAIYCISVLEHSQRRHSIISEFSRLLSPGGFLVLTFDISLDGLGGVSPNELGQMVAEIRSVLEPTDPQSLNRLLDREEIRHADNVTTLVAARWNSALLPWRYPFLSTLLSALKQGKIPRRRFRNTTFSCHIFKKKGAAK